MPHRFQPVRLMRLAALLVALLPALAGAACNKSDPGTLRNYDGSIGDGLRVRMTLVLDGPKVEGLYFYASKLRDIRLRGRIENGTDLLLEELDAGGKVAARFEARFASQDPRGRFSGNALECEVITGSWQQAGSPRALPVLLGMESASAGTLANRYAPAGADNDELIHRNALRFREAVKRNDRKAVAALVAYPIRAGTRRLRNAAELIANYDAIFTESYRAAIANALPRNMFVRDQGIMLGNGEAWFNPDGKVIALNAN